MSTRYILFLTLLAASDIVLPLHAQIVNDGATRTLANVTNAITGDVTVLTGADAQHARGPGLNPRSWHVIRGGIDGVVIVAITDPDDPAPTWVISSRTPDRLASALRRAQATRRTPGR